VELSDEEWNQLRAYIEPLARKLVREARTDNGGSLLASCVAMQVATSELMAQVWKEHEPAEASRVLVLAQKLFCRYCER
jgi:hypothetical protein